MLAFWANSKAVDSRCMGRDVRDARRAYELVTTMISWGDEPFARKLGAGVPSQVASQRALLHPCEVFCWWALELGQRRRERMSETGRRRGRRPGAYVKVDMETKVGFGCFWGGVLIWMRFCRRASDDKFVWELFGVAATFSVGVGLGERGRRRGKSVGEYFALSSTAVV